MRTISKSDLLMVFFRAFLIQGSWNYQRLQNLGFCYCLVPILRRLYPKKEARAVFMHRHLEYFNAHPYLASYVLGAVARLEEQNLFDQWDSSRPILVFKNRLCGPLGAIGDKFFWGTVRPLAALIGLLFTFLFGFLGPVVFLIVHNIPHIYLRYHGVTKGYRMGFDIVREFSKRRFEESGKRLRTAALVFLGLVFGYILVSVVGETGVLNLVLFILVMAVTWVFIRRKKPIIWPVMINLVLLLIHSYLLKAI